MWAAAAFDADGAIGDVRFSRSIEFRQLTLAATRAFFVRRSIRSLADAVHTVTIRVLGEKPSASTGRMVVVDRWVAV